MRVLLVAAAVLLGVVRVLGTAGLFRGLPPLYIEVFKDAAHLYTGAVIGAAVLARLVFTAVGEALLNLPLLHSSGGPCATGDWLRRFQRTNPHALLVRLAVGLSVLETACAIIQRVVLAPH